MCLKQLLVLCFCIFSINAGYAQSGTNIDSMLKVVVNQKDTSRLKTLEQIGHGYVRRALLDSGLLYYNQVLEIAKENNNTLFSGIGHLGRATVYTVQEKYDSAFPEFLEALKFGKQCNDYKTTANAQRSIGYIYNTQGKRQQALGYLRQAERELLMTKDTFGLLLLYPDLGPTIGALGDTSKALEYLQGGLDLCDQYEANNKLSSARKESLIAKRLVFFYNMTEFLSPKDYPSTLTRLNKLWATIKEGNNAYQKFRVLNCIADLHYRLNHYREAMDNGLEAIKNFPDNGNYRELRDIYWTIASSAAELENYKVAFTNFKEYARNNDSVYNHDKIETIHDLETKYETSKKEELIARLDKQSKRNFWLLLASVIGLLIVVAFLLLAIRSARLQKKLFAKEKEAQRLELQRQMFELEQTALRAQMNPHFIFNSLNSIQRFVINNDTTGVNNYLSTFASLIRQTLENSGKASISLRDELKYLETYIRLEQLRSSPPFNYIIRVDENLLIDDYDLPSMIIQPFVENCIRYGLPEAAEGKGELVLSVSGGDILTIKVSDNGPGIGKTHFVKHTHVSMGSGITQKRIDLYNSSHKEKIRLEIIDKETVGNEHTGTLIILQFPVKEK